MHTTALVSQWIVRVAGIILIVLGVLFWTGRALSLIPLHMLLGLILVLALWLIAALAARAHAGAGMVLLAVVWGLVLLAVGMTQRGMLVGSLHWIIQVVHLLLGLGAIGLSERLATRIQRVPVATP